MLLICEWTITKVSPAFAVKLCTGQINLEQRAIVLATFNKLVVESLTGAAGRKWALSGGGEFVDQHALGLRASDALHLAVASDQGAKVHTLDRRLAEAGLVLGVPTRLMA